MSKKLLILFAALLVTGIYGVYRWQGSASMPLKASGVLEARNINVGSKTGGRILEVRVREGEHVAAGQILVVFDGAEQAARLEQARGRLAQAQANLDKMLNGSRPEEIAESRAAVKLPQGRPGFRREEVNAARADLARAKTDSANAEREYGRIEALLKRGVTSRQSFDDAYARRTMASAQVTSLRHALDAAEGRFKAAEAVMERTENGFRKEDVAGARADLLNAEGQVHEAEVLWNEHEVRAPAPSVVEVLDLRPGHLLVPNAIVARLLEDDQLYVMVYVPETQIGRVRLGQKAEIRVDSFPDRSFSAAVEQIRQQAEFLPRNVQTLEERVHQVIGVRLRIANADHRLRAGIHADVRFFSPEE
jgi:HlyD family secretion protein